MPRRCGPQVAVRDAISETCELVPDNARFLSPEMDRYIARYERASGCRVPRDLHLDRPARTLTVRNLAGRYGRHDAPFVTWWAPSNVDRTRGGSLAVLP